MSGPTISVVVCNYNGGETLRETLDSLVKLDYPNYEVVYVDDGSTDNSLEIAKDFEKSIKIIAQANAGLSVARNVGWQASSGEIVAYIDSDAFADPDWLRFLVLSLESGDYAGVGGPNLTPESDGIVAQFIALCPGNPTYVLRDNVHADHIAGVNMAFRREALEAINGFDPVHCKAGDDVDVCWRLEDIGLRLAFSPTAIVWHHRRPSLSRYLKQQYGYGEAENQLERKHPERFNLGGYIRWGGRIYQGPTRITALFKPFIYHGEFGTALFQTLYQKDPSLFTFGPSMIHWYLCAFVLVGLFWLSPWLLAVGATMLGLSLWVALIQGLTKQVPVRLSRREELRKVMIVTWLHFVHPLVRWYGRVFPKRGPKAHAPAVSKAPKASISARLRELWIWMHGRRKELRSYWGVGQGDRLGILRDLHASLKAQRLSVHFGQDWANWDLRVDGPLVAEGRIYTAPEHYDQALCCGFLARSKRSLVFAAVLTFGLATAWTIVDWRAAPSLLAPLLLLWVLLGRRARLRAATWEAVDRVMLERGATSFSRAPTSRAASKQSEQSLDVA